jgi:hypothetical protein
VQLLDEWDVAAVVDVYDALLESDPELAIDGACNTIVRSRVTVARLVLCGSLKSCTEEPHGSKSGSRSMLATDAFSVQHVQKCRGALISSGPIGFILRIGLCMLWAMAYLSMVSFDCESLLGYSRICFERFASTSFDGKLWSSS